MCGIFGTVSREPNSDLIDDFIIGLSALQPRGEESAGAAYNWGQRIMIHKDFGLISQVFTREKIAEIKSRYPRMIIGQNHYSTSAKAGAERNIPPQWIDPPRGRIAMVHNGNIPNLEVKKKFLENEAQGEIRFDYDSSELMNDSEFMINKIYWLMSKDRWDATDALINFIQTIPGSYSAALISRDGVYVFRDTYANMPLWVLETSKAVYFASETCALKHFGSGKLYQAGPGAIIGISPQGEIFCDIKVSGKNKNLAHCIFQNIYFARPDSRTFTNWTEQKFRFRLGQEMARLFPVPSADFITYIPKSGLSCAQGFAAESKKPLISVYLCDGYIGRTFICPDPGMRERLAELKLSLIEDSVRDKVVILNEDSIVRGTVMKKRIKELKSIGGAKEVHIRVSAPPIICPCYYGIDMKTKEELIAARLGSTEKIRQEIDADSLAYLPIESLKIITEESGVDPNNVCFACFDGNYPIPLQ